MERTVDTRHFESSLQHDATARDDENAVARAHYRSTARVAKWRDARTRAQENGTETTETIDTHDIDMPFGGGGSAGWCSDGEQQARGPFSQDKRSLLETSPLARVRPHSASKIRNNAAKWAHDGSGGLSSPPRARARPQSAKPSSRTTRTTRTSRSTDQQHAVAWSAAIMDGKRTKWAEMLQSGPRFQDHKLQKLEAETYALLEKVSRKPTASARASMEARPHEMAKSPPSTKKNKSATPKPRNPHCGLNEPLRPSTSDQQPCLAVGSGLQVVRRRKKTSQKTEAAWAAGTASSRQRHAERAQATAAAVAAPRQAIIDRTKARSQSSSGHPKKQHPTTSLTHEELEKRRADATARATVMEEMGWLADLGLRAKAPRTSTDQDGASTEKKTKKKKKKESKSQTPQLLLDASGGGCVLSLVVVRGAQYKEDESRDIQLAMCVSRSASPRLVAELDHGGKLDAVCGETVVNSIAADVAVEKVVGRNGHRLSIEHAVHLSPLSDLPAPTSKQSTAAPQTITPTDSVEVLLCGGEASASQQALFLDGTVVGSTEAVCDLVKQEEDVSLCWKEKTPANIDTPTGTTAQVVFSSNEDREGDVSFGENESSPSLHEVEVLDGVVLEHELQPSEQRDVACSHLPDDGDNDTDPAVGDRDRDVGEDDYAEEPFEIDLVPAEPLENMVKSPQSQECFNEDEDKKDKIPTSNSMMLATIAQLNGHPGGLDEITLASPAVDRVSHGTEKDMVTDEPASPSVVDPNGALAKSPRTDLVCGRDDEDQEETRIRTAPARSNADGLIISLVDHGGHDETASVAIGESKVLHIEKEEENERPLSTVQLERYRGEAAGVVITDANETVRFPPSDHTALSWECQDQGTKENGSIDCGDEDDNDDSEDKQLLWIAADGQASLVIDEPQGDMRSGCVDARVAELPQIASPVADLSYNTESQERTKSTVAAVLTSDIMAEATAPVPFVTRPMDAFDADNKIPEASVMPNDATKADTMANASQAANTVPVEQPVPGGNDGDNHVLNTQSPRGSKSLWEQKEQVDTAARRIQLAWRESIDTTRGQVETVNAVATVEKRETVETVEKGETTKLSPSSHRLDAVDDSPTLTSDGDGGNERIVDVQTQVPIKVFSPEAAPSEQIQCEDEKPETCQTELATTAMECVEIVDGAACIGVEAPSACDVLNPMLPLADESHSPNGVFQHTQQLAAVRIQRQYQRFMYRRDLLEQLTFLLRHHRRESRKKSRHVTTTPVVIASPSPSPASSLLPVASAMDEVSAIFDSNKAHVEEEDHMSASSPRGPSLTVECEVAVDFDVDVDTLKPKERLPDETRLSTMKTIESAADIVEVPVQGTSHGTTEATSSSEPRVDESTNQGKGEKDQDGDGDGDDGGEDGVSPNLSSSSSTSSSTLAKPVVWERYMDNSMGKSFYFNTNRRISQWDQPADESVVVDKTVEQMNDHQGAAADSSSSSFSSTEQEHGALAETDTDLDRDPAAPVGMSSAAASQETSPHQEKWERYMDTGTNKSFYFHPKRKLSRWDRPDQEPVVDMTITQDIVQEAATSEPIASASVVTQDSNWWAQAKASSTLLESHGGWDHFLMKEGNLDMFYHHPARGEYVYQSACAGGAPSEFTAAKTQLLREETTRWSLKRNSSLRADTRGEWQAFVDKETHQTFYYNTRTNESSWDKPPAFIQPSSSSFDAAGGKTTFPWVMYVDATTSQPYYVNLVTNVTSWQKPAEFDGAFTADDGVQRRMSRIHEPPSRTAGSSASYQSDDDDEQDDYVISIHDERDAAGLDWQSPSH